MGGTTVNTRKEQKYRHLLVLLLVFCGSSVASCGTAVQDFENLLNGKPNKTVEESETADPAGIQIVSPEASEFEEVSVGMNLGSRSIQSGFSLVNASRTKVSLEGCKSGYSLIHDTALNGPALKVYTTDADCVAKLLEFDFLGETYTPDSGLPFLAPVRRFFQTRGKQPLLKSMNLPICQTPLRRLMLLLLEPMKWVQEAPTKL